MTCGLTHYPMVDELFGTDIVGQPVLTLNIVGELKSKQVIFGDKAINVPSSFIHLGSVQFCYPIEINATRTPCTELFNVDFKFFISLRKRDVFFKLINFARQDSESTICDKINATWIGCTDDSYRIFTSFILTADDFNLAVKDTCLSVLTKCKNVDYQVKAYDLSRELILQETTLKSDRKMFVKVLESVNGVNIDDLIE